MELLKKLVKASMYIVDHEFKFTDLKPHNIFVTQDGSVKVIDFEYKTCFDNLKYFKNRYGSVYFVSPEVIRGHHSLDWLVWNIGIIAYFLITGKQPFEVYGFKHYQTKICDNEIDLTISEFDDLSEEFMDLLEKMLNSDQFLRSSIMDCTHHKLFFKKYEGEDAHCGIEDQEAVKERLKIFQGEMDMYSAIVGILYTQVVYLPAKWNKKIKKNLKRVLVNSKVPKSSLSEAFKFLTIDPKICNFHTEMLLKVLPGSQTEFTIDEVIAGMKSLDISHYQNKIKESFKNFPEEGIPPEVILRVLKRVHPTKESSLIDQISQHKNEEGRIKFDSLLKLVSILYP
ncbi:unnamed protein product [Moneuplotes crassus]|uniref:Protein kinase domain-containing protein n=1 Tax=Euplotes crassus TaxID=5936 RepID=A0AAD1YCL7_EUPCR|nr:unnamed protein product [Moneuplotes crassus]